MLVSPSPDMSPTPVFPTLDSPGSLLLSLLQPSPLLELLPMLQSSSLSTSLPPRLTTRLPPTLSQLLLVITVWVTDTLTTVDLVLLLPGPGSRRPELSIILLTNKYKDNTASQHSFSQ